VDFVLRVPPGGQITGNVFDQVLFDQLPSVDFPLMHVNLSLLMDDGSGNFDNHVADTQTGRDGNFTFSGLADGDYKFFTTWMPQQQGYTFECYGGQPCDWGTDFSDPANGTVITISGGSVFGNADIGLDFSGDRIVGTVTRSDTGEPVSSDMAWMGVHLFFDSGNDTGEARGTNTIGQYTFDVGPNDYMLSTGSDAQFHNLINEAWDNVPCFEECNPAFIGGDVINFTGGTFYAGFVLDPATIISGQVTAAEGGVPVADVEVCVARQSDGWWMGCDWTDDNGDYAVAGLEPRNDYEVFTSNLNGQPYLSGGYPGTVDTTGGDQGGIDFALDSGFHISGTVRDAASPFDPVEGATVCIHYTDGSFAGVCGDSDASGYYETGVLPPGSEYVAYTWFPAGYRRQIYDGLDCPFNNCDLQAGTPITLGSPDHATGIDFNLTAAGSISGTISDINGILPNWSGRARITDASGATLIQVGTDGDGFYIAGGLDPGTYYVLGVSADSNLIDELWDGPGNPGTHCPRHSCDYPASGTAIVITGSEIFTEVDFVLDAGSRITGTITIDGIQQNWSEIYFYDGDGDYAGWGLGDGAGFFQSASGFPAGTWYASNRGVLNGVEQPWNQMTATPTAPTAASPATSPARFRRLTPHPLTWTATPIPFSTCTTTSPSPRPPSPAPCWPMTAARSVARCACSMPTATTSPMPGRRTSSATGRPGRWIRAPTTCAPETPGPM
jgi:hypothetical protein